jgi:succinylglutamate desuccinylase
MLSDKFYEKEYSENSGVSEKIAKLEELSISMTNLIDSGNSQKIQHLEKMRQKILKDIIKKKETIGKHLEPQISNIFYLNNKMIEKVQKEKTESLTSIKKKIKFYESYK